MAALVIARVNLLRMMRDGSSLFFVFLLPLIIITALGAMYGSFGTSRLGVVRTDAGALGDDLVTLLEQGPVALNISEYAGTDELRDAVQAGRVEAGLVIPPGYDAALRAGDVDSLTFVARPDNLFSAARQGVDAAIAEQAAQVRAARVAGQFAGLAFEPALALARTSQAALPALQVTTTSVGTALFPADVGAFAMGAQGEVVLFMFLTSMTAATQLILTRQLGVSRRMLATPTPVRSILLGELLGRFAVAMMQGVFIVVTSALIFGVAWGDLLGATLVITLFALVGTGAALSIAVLATNVNQAAAIGVVAGLVLGALGGSMVPTELFEEPMSTISRLTPHNWAIEALRDLGFHGAGVVDILLPLAVLAAMALGLVALGTWGLRRSLTRG